MNLREAAQLALAEPTSQESRQVEPVAWRTFDGEGGYDYRTYEDNENYAADWAQRNPRHVGWVEALYTAPPKRKPLTDWEIEVWAQKPISRIALCRAVERAHGIGGEE